jgi:hypothetical protein
LNLLSPRKRAASRELEIALHYFLHDAENLVPLLKETYKARWSGFIDDILKGARPYEEATALIGIFLQNSFHDLDREARSQIVASIDDNNLVNPPNLLRIVGQVSYLLYLAEQDKQVREKMWTIWVNDMSKMFSEAEFYSLEDCSTYLVSLANSYRDAKRSRHFAKQTG